ncbi:MAG: hemerythrin domain-containing protein [Planctomycetes bacterium]|nr:hemerythrin domain-containing protein [Planctomycetota bacterium]
MSDAPSSDPTGETRRLHLPRLQQDHLAMRRLVDRLEAAKGPDGAGPLLDDLHDLLEAHFAREEGPDGLREMVDRDDPAGIEDLLADHETIRSKLTELRRRIAAGGAPSVTDIVGLTGLLRDHEARESRIVADTTFRRKPKDS